MKLQNWMTANGHDDVTFADLHGEATPFAVMKWRKGERIPRPAKMQRIAAVTDQQVTANDFFAPEAQA